MKLLLGLVAVIASLVPAASAAAVVDLHAHRGGPLLNGVPISGENSLPAFANSWDRGVDVIEFDAKLSRDGVPVVMHDDTLDRTTTCSGRVDGRTIAELAECYIDILGTDGNFRELPSSTVAIPTLAQALGWARSSRARLNLEIKNQPTDDDFEAGPSPQFAHTVLDEVERSGVPKSRLLIQSFWPPNLDVAKARGFRTSFLSLQQTNEGSLDFAIANGYDVISPGWPVSNPRAYVQRAHAAGKEVVPYTLDRPVDIRAAAEAGVDAIISNDPARVMGTVETPQCTRAKAAVRRAERALRRNRAALGRARTRAGRRRIAAKVRASRRRLRDARQARERSCPP
jgi:glycerophosphoryl diester phosphodiesterase